MRAARTRTHVLPQSSCDAHAGHPVRRGLSAQALDTGSPGHPRSSRGQAPGDDDRGSSCLKFESENRDFLLQVGGRAPVTLAIPQYRCYIAKAKLRRASGAIISPGPYRSFRELSLAGSVDPDIWCPPTFVGNSGIERSNGHRGFALFVSAPPVCFCISGRRTPPHRGSPPASPMTGFKRSIHYSAVIRLDGSMEYWIARFRG